MTSRHLGIAGFILAILSAVGGVAMVLSSTSMQYGQLLATVTQTQRDVAEIKATIATIAPPTIKRADSPAMPATTSTTADAEVEPLPVWHRAFIADKCRLCPGCCATAATGDP